MALVILPSAMGVSREEGVWPDQHRPRFEGQGGYRGGRRFDEARGFSRESG